MNAQIKQSLQTCNLSKRPRIYIRQSHLRFTRTSNYIHVFTVRGSNNPVVANSLILAVREHEMFEQLIYCGLWGLNSFRNCCMLSSKCVQYVKICDLGHFLFCQCYHISQLLRYISLVWRLDEAFERFLKKPFEVQITRFPYCVSLQIFATSALWSNIRGKSSCRTKKKKKEENNWLEIETNNDDDHVLDSWDICIGDLHVLISSSWSCSVLRARIR